VTVAPFDPARARQHRVRAERSGADGDFLRARVAGDLAERLEAVNRTFSRVLVLGGGDAFVRAVCERSDLRGKVGEIVVADVAPLSGGTKPELGPTPALSCTVVADFERLPFADASFDLVVSVLALHWVNDLPGTLIQIRRALKPDGLFLGALFGGETLGELRATLLAAESDIRGGAALRVAPFADARDLGGLLQRAGFALPVADRDAFTVRYAEPLRLFADLRAMGETSALTERAPPLTRTILARALDLYRDRFSDPDGRVRATFEVLTATGWSPHESQQKPLRPGSAKSRLADALGVREESTGEKAGD
jgi:SAM-dependent methyltransferase